MRRKLLLSVTAFSCLTMMGTQSFALTAYAEEEDAGEAESEIVLTPDDEEEETEAQTENPAKALAEAMGKEYDEDDYGDIYTKTTDVTVKPEAEATEEAPAEMGKSFLTYFYNVDLNAYEQCVAAVTGISEDGAAEYAQEMIDEGYSLELNDDVTCIFVEYELYLPTDSYGEDGVFEPSLYFNVYDEDGESIQLNEEYYYVSTLDYQEGDYEYYSAGETVSRKELLIVPKNQTSMLLEVGPYSHLCYAYVSK